MVGHAKRVDNLLLWIILLRIYVVVAICGKESLHIVVLCLVCHEEHVVIAILLKYGRYSVASWRNCALHQIAEHHGRKRIERCRHAMIGMYSGRIAMSKSHGVVVQRVECWCKSLLLSKGLQQVGRHRLHKYHHNILLMCCSRVVGNGICRVVNVSAQYMHRVALAGNAQAFSCQAYGSRVGHKVQVAVLLAHVIKGRCK